jgi:hypothetical protein
MSRRSDPHRALARFSRPAVIALSGLLLLFPAGSGAATVTVGSPLTAPFKSEPCTTLGTCTGINAVLPESGALVASPIDGVVVRWRMMLGAPPFRYKLRVLAPAGGTTYTGAGSSAAETPTGPGLETFAAGLPIKAGQVIGFDVEPKAPTGFAEENGGIVLGWIPALPDGATAPAGASIDGEIAFNADVQPAPTISGLSPATGSFKGGAKVVIAGTDFAGVGAVAFGGVPAKSYTVDSEGQITAVSPSIKPLSKVPVSVTTVAGTATSATLFKGAACVVPNLKGKKLKAVRKKLKKKSCKLGKVKGKKSKAARVKKQKPKPGKKLAPGSKVKVTLR